VQTSSEAHPAPCGYRVFPGEKVAGAWH